MLLLVSNGVVFQNYARVLLECLVSSTCIYENSGSDLCSNIWCIFVVVIQNNIPVFCPGLTDGSLGDMLYFHSFRSPGLIVDVVQGMLLVTLSLQLIINLGKCNHKIACL